MREPGDPGWESIPVLREAIGVCQANPYGARAVATITTIGGAAGYFFYAPVTGAEIGLAVSTGLVALAHFLE